MGDVCPSHNHGNRLQQRQIASLLNLYLDASTGTPVETAETAAE